MMLLILVYLNKINWRAKNGLLITNLFKHRARTAATMASYPGKFSLLTDPLTADGCMKDLQTDLDDYQWLKAQTGPFWRKLLEMHYFTRVHGEQMTLLAANQHWSSGPPLSMVVANQFAGPTNTKHVEDGKQCNKGEMEVFD